MDTIVDALLADPSLTVVTATDHLARALEEAVAERRLAAGARVWPSPDVLAWQPWLQRIWSELAALRTQLPMLLDDDQSRALWTRVIDDDPEVAPGQAARLAAVATRSWRTAFAHGLDPATVCVGHLAREGEILTAPQQAAFEKEPQRTVHRIPAGVRM